MLSVSDIVVIDEAAAIPLNILKNIIERNQTIYLASTNYGYEGTGRLLFLEFFKQLNDQYQTDLKELSLNESIRYSSNCPIEKWLNNLLCLNDKLIVDKVSSYTPEKCQLYY